MALTRAEIYANLAELLHAAVSMPKALETAVANDLGPLPQAFRKAASSITNSNTQLWRILELRPELFPKFDVMMIRVGEEAGGLPEALRELSGWYAFSDRMRKIIVSGLIYPLLIFHAACFVAPLPMLFSPDGGTFAYVFGVIGMLLLLYVPGGAILAVVRLTPKEGQARAVVDEALIRLPVVSGATLNLSLSRYCRSFYALYEAGVPVTKVADVAADLCGNAAVRSWLIGGADAAKAGRPVSAGFTDDVPDDLLAVWRVGEESGDLGAAVLRLAESRAEKAKHRFEQLAQWLPWLVYGIVLAIMSYFILSTLLGIYGSQMEQFRQVVPKR